MDKTKKMSVAVIGIAIVLFAAACVTASSQISSTPLYTLRMEQASGEMNFLPTETNGFYYTAENGYTLNYDASGRGYNVERLDTYQYTCEFYPTCNYTCPVTCGKTCPYTCDGHTCPYTCVYTCEGPTCWGSCSRGPGETCGPECP
jgi:hypothetical protein